MPRMRRRSRICCCSVPPLVQFRETRRAMQIGGAVLRRTVAAAAARAHVAAHAAAGTGTGWL